MDKKGKGILSRATRRAFRVKIKKEKIDFQEPTQLQRVPDAFLPLMPQMEQEAREDEQTKRNVETEIRRIYRQFAWRIQEDKAVAQRHEVLRDRLIFIIGFLFGFNILPLLGY